MSIAIICFPGCDVINFEINIIFLIKPVFYLARKSRQKFKYLENKKSFYVEIKSIFHHIKRAFCSQNLSQTLECAFKTKMGKRDFSQKNGVSSIFHIQKVLTSSKRIRQTNKHILRKCISKVQGIRMDGRIK